MRCVTRYVAPATQAADIRFGSAVHPRNATPAMQAMDKNESWKLESRSSSGLAMSSNSPAMAAELSNSSRRKEYAPPRTIVAINAARKTGGRCSITAT